MSESADVQVFVDPTACELDGARHDLDLAYVGLDSNGTRFVATLDRLAGSSASDVVCRVLDNEGYANNLENQLACLGDLSYGVRVRLRSRPSSSGKPWARAYAPCIAFRLPTRQLVGPLVKQLHESVGFYEQEIARLRARGRGNTVSDSALQKSLQAEKQKTDALEQKLAELARECSVLRRSHQEAARALEQNQALPADVRSGRVQECSLASRTALVKSGRKSYPTPLACFRAAPEEGARCLITLRAGEVVDVLLHGIRGQEARPYAYQLAEVIAAPGGAVIKVRDADRRACVLSAVNMGEQRLFELLQRGDRILLGMLDDRVAALWAVTTADPRRFAARMRMHTSVAQITAQRPPGGDSGE